VAHVARIFTERPFRLDGIRRNDSFYDDFRSRRNQQVDGLTRNHRDRFPGQAAGEPVFIEIVGYLRRR
jgi:hypothetical protein